LATFFCVNGYAQTAEQDTHHPEATPNGNMPLPTGDPAAQIARMDEQMKTMQVMHDKMMQAKTPAEQNALMAEQMKVMQDSMAMMGEMSPGGMMGKGGMGTRHQMMEKRMQMMQSMMQMMTDRMPADSGKS